jgi:polysaccharide export outer membrane protein
MAGKFLRFAALLLLSLQVAGCYTDYGPIQAEVRPVGLASVAARLEPGDKLKITVYGEDTLSGPYDISPAGSIAMPLIGTVRAAGRTRSELEREIANRYRSGGFLQDPKVTVAVAEFRPFYVMGEVERPGEYPFRSGLNVHTAVTMAGGFTYRATRDSVLIRHVGDQVWREYPLTEPVPIEPGDLIRVPERYF